MPARLAIVALAALSVTTLSAASERLPQGEVLYNAIRLPTPWPLIEAILLLESALDENYTDAKSESCATFGGTGQR